MNRDFVDVLTVANTLAAIAGIVPAISAVVSLIWVCLRIYETRTVQKWVTKND